MPAPKNPGPHSTNAERRQSPGVGPLQIRDSIPQIADAVGRGTGFVKSVLRALANVNTGKAFIRELGFRLGRDQLDRNKLPNEHRGTLPVLNTFTQQSPPAVWSGQAG